MSARKLPMVDLQGQYQRLKPELDIEIQNVMESCQFIGGPQVEAFEHQMADQLQLSKVISCANGTDALQIALMALDLPKGSKIMVPAFSYIAATEMAILQDYEVVFSDVCPKTFNLTLNAIEAAWVEGIRALVVVHLFGQMTQMDEISAFCKNKNVVIIEDNAQSVNSYYLDGAGMKRPAGTMGTFATYSFFPSKNLACYGDGGAVICNDAQYQERTEKIPRHGQSKKYHHAMVGINSRLDALQAAVLKVKLRHLESFTAARRTAADRYDAQLEQLDHIMLPYRADHVWHVFHQYTIRVQGGHRDDLAAYLKSQGIPSMIYYPLPVYRQKAYPQDIYLEQTERLCTEVLSLPMHTELSLDDQAYITGHIHHFFASL